MVIWAGISQANDRQMQRRTHILRYLQQLKWETSQKLAILLEQTLPFLLDGDAPRDAFLTGFGASDVSRVSRDGSREMGCSALAGCRRTSSRISSSAQRRAQDATRHERAFHTITVDAGHVTWAGGAVTTRACEQVLWP